MSTMSSGNNNGNAAMNQNGLGQQQQSSSTVLQPPNSAYDTIDIDAIIEKLLEVRGCRPGKSVQVRKKIFLLK
jgi:hypothetical protein